MDAQVPHLGQLGICVSPACMLPAFALSRLPRIAIRVGRQYVVVLLGSSGGDDETNICSCSVQVQFLLVFEYF